MKRHLITGLILLVCLCVSSEIFAQNAKLTAGNTELVKSEKSISIKFSYDNMKVGKESEAGYTERKVKENNADKPGKGDEWLKKWVADRKEVYEPAFMKYFKKISKMDVTDNAKYTLVFHTTTFEPGFNALIERKKGFIEATATVVETQNPSKVIAEIDCGKIISRSLTETYTVASRLEVSYATAGEITGKLFK